MVKTSTENRKPMFLTTVVFFFVLAGNQTGIYSKDIRIGALIPWNGSWPAGPRLASAIIVAIDKVRDLNLLPGYNLTYIWRDSFCQIGPSLRAVADLRGLKPSIDVFIGPACSMGCMSSGFLAAHWDLPMISYGCIDEDLSDKSTYPTFVRTVGPFSQSGNLLLLLMEQYGWNRVAILTSTEPVWSQLASLAKGIIDSKPKLEVSYFESFSPDFTSDVQYRRMIQSARKKAHGTWYVCFSSVVWMYVHAYHHSNPLLIPIWDDRKFICLVWFPSRSQLFPKLWLTVQASCWLLFFHTIFRLAGNKKFL